MKIGYVGLGKMGMGQVKRLLEKGHGVVAWNRSEGPREEAKKEGAEIAETYGELCSKLESPKTIWLMLPWKIVDEAIYEILPHLEEGDTLIDGGNSPFKESIRRSKELSEKGIRFLDAGVSGGPKGAREGACIMVGGDRKLYDEYKNLFEDLSAKDAYGYMGKNGAGHFVKMVHNGIEYGMMQSIAEGFALLRNADLGGSDAEKSTSGLDLKEIARVYNNKSVIESRLVGWLEKAYEEYGVDLESISGEVSHSGEGLWTVETAKELSVPVKVIEDSLKFREDSQGNPSYTGQVVSALRNQFGGHDVSTK